MSNDSSDNRVRNTARQRQKWQTEVSQAAVSEAQVSPPSHSSNTPLSTQSLPERSAVSPKTGQWGPLTAVIYGLCVFFGSQIAAGLLLLAILGLTGKTSTEVYNLLDSQVTAQFAITVLSETLMVAGLVAYVKYHGARMSDIGWNKLRARYVGQAAVWFITYFIVYIVIYAILSEFIPALNTEQKQDLGFSDPTSVRDTALLAVSLIIIPPVAEELLFRGFLYKGMRTRFSVVGATILTSILFAIGHLQIGNGSSLLWVAALDTFILSLFLCYVREKSNSLWPGIFMHAIKNAIAFSALYFVT